MDEWKQKVCRDALECKNRWMSCMLMRGCWLEAWICGAAPHGRSGVDSGSRRPGKSSLTHGKVQLAFANYTCSPCCRGESRVPAELVGTAGRGRGWAVGVRCCRCYCMALWNIKVTGLALRVSSLIKNRARNEGGSVCECEGETEPKRKRKPGASRHHPNYNEFNLWPHPIQIANDLSSCSSLDSWERKDEKKNDALSGILTSKLTFVKPTFSLCDACWPFFNNKVFDA